MTRSSLPSPTRSTGEIKIGRHDVPAACGAKHPDEDLWCQASEGHLMLGKLHLARVTSDGKEWDIVEWEEPDA
jgi:hypothetical protein